ncbi:MAG: ATP:cob(I)alamin adenosyltransferase [Candidatus Zambryskibacteria bacterium]|nr:ATP:cob(I)alamin adenosyltransferase [Candidatus Zambryskibacteria bacterium]
MLYIKNGNNGKMNWGCDQRIAKSSTTAEALGVLDEINSFLGLCKVQSIHLDYKLGKRTLAEIVHEMQKNLFIIQSEVWGNNNRIDKTKVKELEDIIDEIEKELSPVNSFFIAGGSAEMTKWQLGGAGLSTLFDIARTIARRAERRIITLSEEVLQPELPISQNDNKPENHKKHISKQTKAYINRLSSALYALARYANHKVGIAEESPDYL